MPKQLFFYNYLIIRLLFFLLKKQSVEHLHTMWQSATKKELYLFVFWAELRNCPEKNMKN